ncbi:MAG: hypothetical protein R2724_22260 [Bryobacterales bacterium]
MLYVENPVGIDSQMRRLTLDAMRDLNMMQHEREGDPDLGAHWPVRARLSHADGRARGHGHHQGAQERDRGLWR